VTHVDTYAKSVNSCCAPYSLEIYFNVQYKMGRKYLLLNLSYIMHIASKKNCIILLLNIVYRFTSKFNITEYYTKAKFT